MLVPAAPRRIRTQLASRAVAVYGAPWASGEASDGSLYYTRTTQLLKNAARTTGSMHGYFTSEVPTPTTTQMGPGLYYDGTKNSYTTALTGQANGASPDEACIVVFSAASSSGSQNLMGYSNVWSTSLSDYGRGVGIESGQLMAWGASAVNLKRTYVTLPTLNTLNVVGVRFSQNGAVYLNGRKMTAQTGVDLSHSWGYYLAAGSAHGSVEGSGVARFTGNLGLRAWFYSGLTDGELERLTSNPMWLFEEPRTQIFFSASGGVTVNATGVAGTGAVGTLTVAGKANTTATGASATGAAGTATVAAKARVTPTGVGATGAVGTLTTTGKANTTLTGVGATGAVGIVTVTTAGAVSVNLTGVAGTGAVGSVTVDIGGSVSVTPTGVSATGAVGTPTGTGKARTTLTGVGATGAVGTVTVLTPSAGMVYVTGVQGTTGLGSVSVLSGRRVQVTGVSATGLVGYPIVWSNIPTPGGAWAEVPTSATPSWTPVATPTNTWTNVLT